MLELVKNTIANYQLLSANDTVALAISGGKDSVAAAYVLQELEISFVMVHVNFGLRSEDSDGDEIFVKELADKLSYCTAVYSKKVDTKAYTVTYKLGTQEAARKLRYDYFDSLYTEGIFTKIITAHHASDQVETFIINLYRISGLNGLKGIPIKRDYLIRPFLEVPEANILAFIKKNRIHYREDRSNADSHYLRNKIRNKVLPSINIELEDFGNRASQSIAILIKEHDVYKCLIDKHIQSISKLRNQIFEIQKSGILSFTQRGVLLYQILDKYGFNYDQCEQIGVACDTTSGKRFESKTHLLTIDRDFIFVTLLKDENRTEVTIHGVGEYKLGNACIKLQNTSETEFNTNPNFECVSIPSSYFPLVLRYWKEGDTIQPLGMKGSKLISDFFVDLKIPVLQKHKIPLICKENEVLWVGSKRISDKIKVVPKELIFALFLTFDVR